MYFTISDHATVLFAFWKTESPLGECLYCQNGGGGAERGNMLQACVLHAVGLDLGTLWNYEPFPESFFAIIICPHNNFIS